jgi:hypothetical protein
MAMSFNVEELKAMSIAQLEELKKSIDNAENAKKAEAKAEDLKTVKRLCRLHGFTATNLKGFLKTKKKASKLPKQMKKRVAKKDKEVTTK